MLHPETAAYAEGLLDVGDGHRLRWALSGDPSAPAAVVLHGGPGSGASPGARRLFDPARWRVALFDQRGCGGSLPHAAEPGADLSANTTAHLVGDIERLRRHLGVERWLVLGGSWGSTLALAYSEQHPERVAALVLHAVATTTPAEIAWITRGVGAFLPEAFARFEAGVPEAERDDLVGAYHRRLMHPDPAVHARAAEDWCAWEQAVVALHGHPPLPRWADPRFRLGFARLVTHYFRHAAWLEDGVLLREAGRLAGVPGMLIHGRLDLGTPLVTAWRLARAWPGSELVVLGAAGHDGRDPGMAEAIAGAIARLA